MLQLTKVVKIRRYRCDVRVTSVKWFGKIFLLDSGDQGSATAFLEWDLVSGAFVLA